MSEYIYQCHWASFTPRMPTHLTMNLEVDCIHQVIGNSCGKQFTFQNSNLN